MCINIHYYKVTFGCRAVQCAVSCLLEPDKAPNDDHMLSGVLTELPCGCELTTETDPPMVSVKGKSIDH